MHNFEIDNVKELNFFSIPNSHILNYNKIQKMKEKKDVNVFIA